MLRLLSDCPPQQVPHLADALLSMVHTLLEQRDTSLQVLACNTVSDTHTHTLTYLVCICGTVGRIKDTPFLGLCTVVVSLTHIAGQPCM